MARLEPTDCNYDDQAHAFCFKAQVRGRIVQCFISSQAVEYLFGKLDTYDEAIRAICKEDRLVELVEELVAGGAVEPVWLIVPLLQAIHADQMKNKPS